MFTIGEKSLKELSFTKSHHHHHHHHHERKQVYRDVPKGYLAIKVGQREDEQQRFVVPVIYFNHPLFMNLLKEAEEEYGFDQKGTITIPCHVEEFRYVQGKIDKEIKYFPHNNNHVIACFRA
ncbi:Auxin-responsive family protein [Quillaja saponaria]|uniref:Auxin-responsive family protein n=1 Tax=Quillaja saponaria TaxID=32244 RepID=A0AAD7L4W4_QUISA|nr:Auxin-responsive family protein [Quillaja saponaria]